MSWWDYHKLNKSFLLHTLIFHPCKTKQTYNLVREIVASRHMWLQPEAHTAYFTMGTFKYGCQAPNLGRILSTLHSEYHTPHSGVSSAKYSSYVWGQNLILLTFWWGLLRRWICHRRRRFGRSPARHRWAASWSTRPVWVWAAGPHRPSSHLAQQKYEITPTVPSLKGNCPGATLKLSWWATKIALELYSNSSPQNCLDAKHVF